MKRPENAAMRPAAEMMRRKTSKNGPRANERRRKTPRGGDTPPENAGKRFAAA